MIEVRSKGGHWVVKKNGTTVSRHRLKKRATERARREARSSGQVLQVQRADGTIQTRRSY